MHIQYLLNWTIGRSLFCQKPSTAPLKSKNLPNRTLKAQSEISKKIENHSFASVRNLQSETENELGSHCPKFAAHDVFYRSPSAYMAGHITLIEPSITKSHPFVRLQNWLPVDLIWLTKNALSKVEWKDGRLFTYFAQLADANERLVYQHDQALQTSEVITESDQEHKSRNVRLLARTVGFRGMC